MENVYYKIIVLRNLNFTKVNTYLPIIGIQNNLSFYNIV